MLVEHLQLPRTDCIGRRRQDGFAGHADTRSGDGRPTPRLPFQPRLGLKGGLSFFQLWRYFPFVALNVKSPEADRLVRELASHTGETLTQAVTIALQERLDRQHRKGSVDQRLRQTRAIMARVAALPERDPTFSEHRLYDENSLPA